MEPYNQANPLGRQRSSWQRKVQRRMVYSSGACVDYAEVVNKFTVKDRYPMPNLNGTVDNINGVAFISIFDVSQGFHQIPMAKSSIEITAFITHMGLYEFLRMPFGVRNGPSTFQDLMYTALDGLNNQICKVYVDDVIVYSFWAGSEAKTIAIHLHHCRLVLQRMRTANLT